MCMYTIYVTVKGKKYQTNVIANKNQSKEEIHKIGEEQVIRQWGI